MKKYTVIAAVLLSFVVGLGFTFMSPATAVAGGSDPCPSCTWYECYGNTVCCEGTGPCSLMDLHAFHPTQPLGVCGPWNPVCSHTFVGCVSSAACEL